MTELSIDDLVVDLTKEFDQVPTRTVERIVTESAVAFSDARITSFVPIFVRREAAKRLQPFAGSASER